MQRLSPRIMALLAVVLLALACAAPTGAPPVPAPGPAQSTGAPSAEQAEWNRLVEEARKEGEVIIWTGQPGDDARSHIKDAFEKAYPGIRVTLFQAPTTSERDSRYIAERDAGIARIDLMIGGTGSGVSRLIPADLIQDLRPFLVLSEVTDPKNWFGNKLFWSDETEKYIYQPESTVTLAAAVHSSVAPNELQNWSDLLNPKFRGKIVMTDPRGSGSGFARGAFFYFTPELGPEFTRRFYSETGVVFSSDTRQNLQWTVDGRMLVNISPAYEEVADLRRIGVEVRTIADLMVNGKEQNSYAGGSTGIFVPNIDVPHPNATKVYLNWYLSKAGQQAMVDIRQAPSRRLDVDNSSLSSEILPKPGVQYMHMERTAPPDMTRDMRDDVNRWLPS